MKNSIIISQWMKTLLCLTIGILSINSAFAQDGCKICPKFVLNETEGIVYLVFDELPSVNIPTVDFFFGDNNPFNGTYATGGLSTVNTLPVIVPAGMCCGALDVNITINGVQCVYEKGEFRDCLDVDPGIQDCEDIFTLCEVELEDYLNENLFSDNTNCKKWIGDCSLNAFIHREGKVGIYTNDVPSGYKLAVKGGIVTEEIKVQLCDAGQWCDYVFEDDYALLSLEEVECFIEENGHLPKTPSALEVKKDGGFELKAVTINHQEKIEEAFLHLIEMKKKVNQLKAAVTVLKAENKALLNEK